MNQLVITLKIQFKDLQILLHWSASSYKVKSQNYVEFPWVGVVLTNESCFVVGGRFAVQPRPTHLPIWTLKLIHMWTQRE